MINSHPDPYANVEEGRVLHEDPEPPEPEKIIQESESVITRRAWGLLE